MKHTTPTSCNVFQLGDERRSVWRFSTSGTRADPAGENIAALDKALPSSWVQKSWQHYLQPKLNIAWLPADQVFLRVLHLPKCDPAELPQMIEFQLEKISPLPLTHMEWSFERVPYHGSVPTDLQTVIVCIAARDAVGAFLGRLEGFGFRADRLEVPMLHQLLATEIEDDGAWIYPFTHGGRTGCLVAWWHDGALQNLGIVNLTLPENWPQELGAHLDATVWAGELEGWLTSPPHWHLVADKETASAWEHILFAHTEESIAVHEPLGDTRLAAESARRAASGESHANLLPADVAKRYASQLADRVWMRSLGALFLLYLLGVVAYLVALNLLQFQKTDLDSKVASMSGSYTNAVVLKQRIDVLKEQVSLKYAALEGLKAVSERLPEGLTLTDFAFTQGQRFTLRGTAPAADVSKITDFIVALGKAQVNGQPLFASVGTPSIGVAPGTAMNSWTTTLELRGVETK